MGSLDDLETLRADLAKKERELEEQLKLSQQLLEENRSLKSKIEIQEQDCEYWKEQLASQKQDFSRRTTNLEQMADHQLQEIDENLKSCKEDLTTTKTQLAKQRNETDELRQEQNQMLSELQKLTTERDRQVALCADYEQRLAQAKEERDHFYKRVTTVNSELKEERSHTKSLQEQISTLSLTCKKLLEDLEQMEDLQQRYEEEVIMRQNLSRRLSESETTVDQLRLHLSHSQPVTPISSTPGQSLFSEFSPFSTSSQNRSLALNSEEEEVEKDGSQGSPTGIVGRPITDEEVEVEQKRTHPVTWPVLAWEVDSSCCHRCSDLEVKLIQSQKEVEQAQQELKKAQQELEQTQQEWDHAQQDIECRNTKHESSQTRLIDAHQDSQQQQQLQAEQTAQLHHYIKKYNECQNKLQGKSDELSQCRQELDTVSNQLRKAAEQKYHLSEQLEAWQDDMDWLLQKRLMEEVKKLTKPTSSVRRLSKSSKK